jgi:hypothetical protein
MAQMFLDGGNSQEIRERLNQAKAWIEALAPFGAARASLARQEGKTILRVDLGLSAPSSSDRISTP